MFTFDALFFFILKTNRNQTNVVELLLLEKLFLSGSSNRITINKILFAWDEVSSMTDD